MSAPIRLADDERADDVRLIGLTIAPSHPALGLVVGLTTCAAINWLVARPERPRNASVTPQCSP